MIHYMLKVNAGQFSFEAANPRHEHEYHLFETVKVPDGKVLCPGVITHASNIVEHPELIAERIMRYTKLVGRENVMAGADCGFSSQALYKTEVASDDRFGKSSRPASGRRSRDKAARKTLAQSTDAIDGVQQGNAATAETGRNGMRIDNKSCSVRRVSALLSATAPACAQTTMRLLSAWPPNTSMIQVGETKFIANVEAASNKEIKFVRNGPETVPPFQQLQPLSTGVFQLLYTTPVLSPGRQRDGRCHRRAADD